MNTKLIIIALLATLSATTANGQVELVKHSPNLTGHKALVKEWLDTVSLSYVESEKGDKAYFVLDRKGQNTAKVADLPDGARVNDMVVWSEYLCFCGTYKLGGLEYGMVGVLNIPNTFSWGQNYHIGLFDWTPIEDKQIRMTKPMRISRGINNSSDIYVAIVGEAEIRDAANNVTTQTAVCDAKSVTGFTAWWCSYFYSTDPNIVFTDITATDNRHIAVGYHQNHKSTLIKSFKANHPFVGHALTPNNIKEIIDGITTGKVLVDASVADNFALTNFYIHPMAAGITVKVFDALPYLPTMQQSVVMQQNSVPAVPSSWVLREIQYNLASDMYYVLEDVDYFTGSTESAICEFNIPSPTNVHITLPHVDMHGMGDWRCGGFQTVGDNAGQLTYFRKRGGTPSSCKYIYYGTYNNNNVDPTVLYNDEKHNTDYYQMTRLLYPPNLSVIYIKYDCTHFSAEGGKQDE